MVDMALPWATTGEKYHLLRYTWFLYLLNHQGWLWISQLSPGRLSPGPLPSPQVKVKGEDSLQKCSMTCSNMADQGDTFSILWILYLPFLCLNQFDQNVIICCPLVGSIWSCLHVLYLINHNRVDDAVAEQPTAGDGVETLQQQYQRTNNQYQVESLPPSPMLDCSC